jgi:hypothetical protein
MKTLATLTAIILSCSPALAGLAGKWNAVATSENGDREYIVTLSKEGDKLTGTSAAVNEGTDRTIDRITVKEKNVTFEFDFERDGKKGIIRVVADEKSAGLLDGKWSVEGSDGTVYMSGAWRAEKEIQFSLAGEWDALGTSDNGDEYRSVLTVTGSASDTKGKFNSERGEVTLDGIKVGGKKVDLSFALQFDGNSTPTTIEAQVADNDTLKGNWIIKNAEGEVAATGPWTATRKPTFTIAGDWAIVATLPDGGEYKGTISIAQNGDRLSGTTKPDSTDEAKDLTTVKFDGKTLIYTIPFERDGQQATITVQAAVAGAESLEGEWSLTGDDGNELAGDSWNAKRK